MENHLIQKLQEANWKPVTSISRPLKLSQNADFSFYYENKLNSLVEFFVFENENKIRLKVEEKGANDFRWFQLDYKDKSEDLINFLLAEQEQIKLGNYLGFYLGLSDVCPTSILAWEQFE